MERQILTILESASDPVLAASVVEAFKDVERNYFLKNWKTSELDAGHFIEATRRFLDLKLFGSYAPIGTRLTTFNDNALRAYENATGPDAYRILIPRAMYSAFAIRNKRGVGHIGPVSPNYMDATFVIATCQWVLAEIVRQESNLPPNDTARMVTRVTTRSTEGIWQEGDIRRILVPGMTVREQVLFLLFDKSPQNDDELQSTIEATNKPYFRKVLRALHKERLLEYKADSSCSLSPTGRVAAEELILKANSG